MTSADARARGVEIVGETSCCRPIEKSTTVKGQGSILPAPPCGVICQRRTLPSPTRFFHAFTLPPKKRLTDWADYTALRLMHSFDIINSLRIRLHCFGERRSRNLVNWHACFLPALPQLPCPFVRHPIRGEWNGGRRCCF